MTTNSVALPQKCIVMRNGVEVWVERKKAEQFESDWQKGMIRGAVGIEGRTVNTMDVIGVFAPEDMDSATRRKNGDWKCHAGTWHQRFEKCECPSKEVTELNEKISQAIKNCGKCDRGWVRGENGMRRCSCVAGLIALLDKKNSRRDN